MLGKVRAENDIKIIVFNIRVCIEVYKCGLNRFDTILNTNI